MYEQQKQEEEAEKRQKEDFENWLAKYKETMKNGWWLKALSYKQRWSVLKLVPIQSNLLSRIPTNLYQNIVMIIIRFIL